MQHWHRVRAMRLHFPLKLEHIEQTSSFCSAWAIEEFYRLRAARLAGRHCIAVETSVRAELDAPSGLRLAVGMEGSFERIPKVDVYAMEDGMPVFSHAFLHSRRFGADLAEAMLGEIAKAGLEGTPLVTTLGAEDVRRLARLVRQGAPLVMPTDLHQPHVARALRRFPPDGLLRESMELECSSLFNTVLWHRQFAIDRNYAVIDDTSGKERMLNLHIFYDDLVNFSLKNDSIKSFFYRKSSLESILNNATKIESDDLSEYDDEIFDIEYDEKRKLIKNFSTYNNVATHEHRFSGLYTVTTTPVVKYNSPKILEIVNLAYEKTTSCEAMFARCYDDVDNRKLLDLHKEVFHLLVFLAQSLLAFLEAVRREKLAALQERCRHARRDAGHTPSRAREGQAGHHRPHRQAARRLLGFRLRVPGSLPAAPAIPLVGLTDIPVSGVCGTAGPTAPAPAFAGRQRRPRSSFRRHRCPCAWHLCPPPLRGQGCGRLAHAASGCRVKK